MDKPDSPVFLLAMSNRFISRRSKYISFTAIGLKGGGWFPYIAVEKHDVYEGGIPHVQYFSWFSDFEILSKRIYSSIQISVLIMITTESEREWVQTCVINHICIFVAIHCLQINLTSVILLV